MKMLKVIFSILFVTVFLVGCAGMSSTEQRTLSGAAIGAGTGAAIGAVTGGSAATGAVIGGAGGALGGYIYDHQQKKK